MAIKLIIKGTLPTMNEIVEVSKQHWSKYSDMKHTYTNLVAWQAKSLPAIQNKINVVITWYCKDRRQDKDNIMAGQKFIFDGLVAVGRISNDGWKQIGDVTHKFEVDKHNPRVEITIEEIV
jgi:Holliday junction resolvase RusA-like endonuclease